MARPYFEPIIPKRPMTRFSAQKVVREMDDTGLDMVARLATYPPAQTAYRRTGHLGRPWTKDGPKRRGADLIVEAGNVTKYAGDVQGLKTGTPRQKERFARLGWASVEDVGEEVWRAHRSAIERALQGR